MIKGTIECVSDLNKSQTRTPFTTLARGVVGMDRVLAGGYAGPVTGSRCYRSQSQDEL